MLKKTIQIPCLLISSLILTACATSALLEKDSGIRTQTQKINLINDTVVAFGKPAYAVSDIPADSVVIVGEQHSYVLIEGGTQFVKVISSLDPKNIQITKSLNFYSPKNDGHFRGSLALSYVKLVEDVSKNDLNFFIQNSAEECTTSSDKRMLAQRFCFELNLAGVVYPKAKNSQSFKALSKPYHVNIYTTQQVKDYSKATSTVTEKLVLAPFAVAFDVVTLPFQAIRKIFD